MKRLCVLFLSLILAVLPACAGVSSPTSETSSTGASSEPVSARSTVQPEEEEERPLMREPVLSDWDGSETLFPQAVGPFYLGGAVTDGSRLLLTTHPVTCVDLHTGETEIPCFQPDCAHDSQDCSAYRFNGGAFIAAGRLYWLRPIEETVWDEETVENYPQSELVSRSLETGEEKTLGTVIAKNDTRLSNVLSVLFYGNDAFLLSQVTGVDGSGTPRVSTGLGSQKGMALLTRIDLVTDEIIDSRTVMSYFPYDYVSAWFTGAYGGEVMLFVHAWEDPSSALEAVYRSEAVALLPDEYAKYQKLRAELERPQYFRYSLDDGSLTECTDGYPSAFPGPIKEDAWMIQKFSQGLTHRKGAVIKSAPRVYRLSAILGDKAVYVENGLKALDLQSGEETLLYEGEVARLCKIDDQVNLSGSVLTFVTAEGEMRRVDLETGESVSLSLEDGKKIRKVLAEGAGVLYAELETDGLIIAKIDISGGYENCSWEKVE